MPREALLCLHGRITRKVRIFPPMRRCKQSKAPRKQSKAPRKQSKAPRKQSKAPRKQSKAPRKQSKASRRVRHPGCRRD
ncbi:hypothetical protein F4553_003781 [Allocatelliglobosispora scoriae]|uniref:Uncharacterized protein n=1 Tax=Allocatelliglobosispora scoriae TaxID=643052 RepID=A0A841BUI5_9ACTN|nr:hypothetical protein [Allocatelliglobosispora scoriae]